MRLKKLNNGSPVFVVIGAIKSGGNPNRLGINPQAKSSSPLIRDILAFISVLITPCRDSIQTDTIPKKVSYRQITIFAPEPKISDFRDFIAGCYPDDIVLAKSSVFS